MQETASPPPALDDASAQPTPFDARLEGLGPAPTAAGRLELIVRRPAVDEREILEEAVLDPVLGLVGDRWSRNDLATTPKYLAAQLTLISTRVLAAIEPDRSRWSLAGDQLYVDLELSEAVLLAATRIAIGDAVIEVSETPHTGCAKFGARFGGDALRWINSVEGRAARRRGLNARILVAGTVRAGDEVRRA